MGGGRRQQLAPALGVVCWRLGRGQGGSERLCSLVRGRGAKDTLQAKRVGARRWEWGGRGGWGPGPSQRGRGPALGARRGR